MFSTGVQTYKCQRSWVCHSPALYRPYKTTGERIMRRLQTGRPLAASQFGLYWQTLHVPLQSELILGIQRSKLRTRIIIHVSTSRIFINNARIDRKTGAAKLSVLLLVMVIIHVSRNTWIIKRNAIHMLQHYDIKTSRYRYKDVEVSTQTRRGIDPCIHITFEGSASGKYLVTTVGWEDCVGIKGLNAVAIGNRTQKSGVNTVTLLSVTGYGGFVRVSGIHGGWVRICLHVTGSGINGWTQQHSTTGPAAGKQATVLLAVRTRDVPRTILNTLYEMRSEHGIRCRER